MISKLQKEQEGNIVDKLVSDYFTKQINKAQNQKAPRSTYNLLAVTSNYCGDRLNSEDVVNELYNHFSEVINEQKEKKEEFVNINKEILKEKMVPIILGGFILAYTPLFIPTITAVAIAYFTGKKLLDKPIKETLKEQQQFQEIPFKRLQNTIEYLKPSLGMSINKMYELIKNV